MQLLNGIYCRYRAMMWRGRSRNIYIQPF